MVDYSFVQQILDNASTRGTAIISRTMKEMFKDKKVILVALICLFPIILGLVWSHYLSDAEDVEETPINEYKETGEIFCYVDVPEYIPNEGEYTFKGEIINRGDSNQEVAVNMTFGTGNDARQTTGIMNITPTKNSPYAETHQFSITYDMSRFPLGDNYLVIQLFVNNSLSSGTLLPPDFDLLNFNLTGLVDVEELFPQNSAVQTMSVKIKPLDIEQIDPTNQYITKSTDIMPLTVTYPKAMSPDRDNTFNFTIDNPINGSNISLWLLSYHLEPMNLGEYTFNYTSQMTKHNFTMDIPIGEFGYISDQLFQVIYTIHTPGYQQYERTGFFTVDLLKEDYLPPPTYYSITINNDTLYTTTFNFPKNMLRDYYNNMNLTFRNNDQETVEFTVHVTIHAEERTGYHNISYSESFVVLGGQTLDEVMTIPYNLEEVFPDLMPDPYSHTIDFDLEVHFSVGDHFTETDGNTIMSTRLILMTGKNVASLSDNFNPSLISYINLPEDISKQDDTYAFTGTVYNNAVIEKDFLVIIRLQNQQYYSGWFTVGTYAGQEFEIIVDTDNLSREFDEKVHVDVFSSRSGSDPEASLDARVNIIEESHKERKVIENFFTIYIFLYIKFIVPLASMVYGISLISQESERKTLPLYLTTPITRVELVLYKFAGFLVAMTIILSIPLILIYLSFAYVLPAYLIVYYLLLLGICLFDLFIAIAAYGAVFTAIGTTSKRPIIVALVYLLIWEILLGSWNFFLTPLTVFFHLRCAVFPFVSRFMPNPLTALGLTDIGGKEFRWPMEQSMLAIVLVTFLFLFVSVFMLKSRDNS